MRNRYLPRSRPDSAAQRGCAARAASTAARTSCGPANAISATGSSVAGLIVGHARAVDRVAELAADEQPVGVAQADVVGGLGRGRVVPDDAGAGVGHSFEKSSGRA